MISNPIHFYFWKNNFPHDPLCPFVGRLFGGWVWSVCHNFLKGREVPCFHALVIPIISFNSDFMSDKSCPLFGGNSLDSDIYTGCLKKTLFRDFWPLKLNNGP